MGDVLRVAGGSSASAVPEGSAVTLPHSPVPRPSQTQVGKERLPAMVHFGPAAILPRLVALCAGARKHMRNIGGGEVSASR